MTISQYRLIPFCNIVRLPRRTGVCRTALPAPSGALECSRRPVLRQLRRLQQANRLARRQVHQPSHWEHQQCLCRLVWT